MANIYHILAQTPTIIPALTVTTMLDSYTGQTAFIPAGSTVTSVSAYPNPGASLTTGATLELGVAANAGKYISLADLVTTSALNAGQLYTKGINSDMGSASNANLLVTSTATISAGVLLFYITYVGNN